MCLVTRCGWCLLALLERCMNLVTKYYGLSKTILNNSKDALLQLFGTTGCLLTALLAGCIVVSLIMAKWMTPTHEDQNLEIAVKSSLIVLFCLGILGMLSFIYFQRHENHFSENNEDKEEGTEDIHLFLHRLQLLLLGIFAMGSVGHDILKIFDIGQCLDEINKDLKRLKETSLAYECIKLVFELGQIYFIGHFMNYRCRSNITQFILGLIFAANLSIWFYVLVSESLDTWNHKSKNTDYNYTKSSNSTPCDNGNTETSEMLELWQPYLYPLTMEFCLMASGLLGSMWGWNFKSNDRSANQSTEPVISQSETAQQSLREELSQSDNNTTTTSTALLSTSECDTNECTERTRLLSQSNGSQDYRTATRTEQQSSIQENISDKKCSLTNCCEGKSRSCPEVFYLATLLSVTLFFLAAANQHKLWTGYCSAYVVLHLFLLVCSCIVCYVMRKENAEPQQFGPDQILLLVSTSALFLLTLLELIPPLSDISDLDHCERLLIATDFFLLISVFLQTSILFKSEKPGPANRCLRRCFSMIAVLNLYMWFEDSIYAQKLDSILYLKHHQFYDKMVWTVCKLILMPPCIFYRIHVAEMFGERFFKLK